MAKGSGMIHPNMATMLGVWSSLSLSLSTGMCVLVSTNSLQIDIQVVTTDASVSANIWSEMVRISNSRSFNQISVSPIGSV